MRVTLLGTGSADGWPNPFCRCASCAAARRDGVVRAQTSALVDGRLLLDCGPETPRLAERYAGGLAGLQAVLVTHAHPDHLDPAFLLYRQWVAERPLRVVGPPGVADACRPWVPPASGVEVVTVSPGDVLEVAGYRVRVLGARHEAPGGAVLYDVTSASGERLLYATDTGPLDDEDSAVVAAGGPAYSTVLLEETFGDHSGHGTDHLDLASFARVLAGLRTAGAVADDTEVVAVHLSHHNPAGAALARRLAACGARAVPDGTTLTKGAAAEADTAGPAAGRTLVTGGARSGKSREAERLLLDQPHVVYVATGPARDDDPAWARRVAAHRARRPAAWSTVETGDLAPLLAEPGPPLLVDCLTLWLTGVLDRLGAWSDDADTARVEADASAEIEALARCWRGTPRRVVAVTNEVGSGVVPGTVSGGMFRDLLGVLNATVAAESDEVLLCVAGRVVPL